MSKIESLIQNVFLISKVTFQMIASSSVFHGRVVVIGDASVGKTSILNQLIDNKFNEFEASTVGMNYQLFTNDVDGIHVEMQIWDTAGQEKFRSLGTVYFRNSIGAIVVFDLTSRSSFYNLGKWVSAFTDVAESDAVIFIVGNKCDLKDEISLQKSEVLEWVESNGYKYFETSAKTGAGVNELFVAMSRELVQVRAMPNVQRLKKNNSNSNCSC